MFNGRFKIVSNNAISEKVFDMSFFAGEAAVAAVPGQFVNVGCGESLLLRRPISISGSRDGAVRIIYEIKGEGTKYLSERCAGEEVDVVGPLGNGFSIEPQKRTLLVGGGIGAFPLLFAAQEHGNADCVLGFRNSAAVVLKDEFQRICKSLAICTDDGSEGRRGFVTDVVREKIASSDRPDMVLACGPKAMLLALYEILKGTDIKAEFSLEERMGCGIGACLVCACKTVKSGEEYYSRVCKDGPVFDLEKISF